MLYIVIGSLILTIFSFMYLFVMSIKRYVFLEKIKDINLKLIIASSCVLLFWLLTYSLNAVYERIQNPPVTNGIEQYSGTLGDLVGGTLNPILGLFGIIVGGLAFYAQYEANKQVREQFEKQEKKEYRQNFESNFFNLINIHLQIVSDIDIHTKKVYHFEEDLKEFIKINEIINESFTKNLIEDDKYSGRDVFNYYFDLLDYLLWIDLYILSNKVDPKYQEHVDLFEKLFTSNYKIIYKNYTLKCKFPLIYEKVYNTINSDFGHYFRNLYRIIKYVDSMKFSEDILEDFKIKYSYTSIIRSQLSDAELKVIFFNCIYYYGKEKFKPLLEKYSFFKFINTDEDDSDNIFKDYYKFYDDVALNPIKDKKILLEYLRKDYIDELKIEMIQENTEIKIQA